MAAILTRSFEQTAQELRPQIEEALDRYTRFPAGCPTKLAESIRYSLLAPGKRLRPLLVLMASEACGGRIENAMPAACAVEMIHCYSLIHDDLPAMDDDDLRRGRPTNHKVYGEAMAILAGDSLLTRAFEIVARDVHPPQVAAACCATLADASGAAALVGGQADDILGEQKQAQSNGNVTQTDRAASPEKLLSALESIHERKTGVIFLVSLRLGALTAAANAVQIHTLEEYGRRLGLAFQIADDLLDVQGNEETTGKRVGKDADRGKLTFPGLLGIDESVRRARRLVAEACDLVGPLGPSAEPLASLRALRRGARSLMDQLLSKIESPRDLQALSLAELEQLAGEMREALCNLVTNRTAHFASNLGVVELCLALHSTFDFSRDRLIWDTGHQIYPHKLITGRYHEFGTIRSKGGLMGYPNPHESDYDLFMTGHAGASVSTILGLKTGDDLLPDLDDRHAVAVIGDGALPSGMVFEALNNAGGLKKKITVILNDNKMSICPRVGGLAQYLDRLRMNPIYTGLKHEVVKALNKVPLLGNPVERLLWQAKESIKAGLHGGMLFEELGLRYVGPIDGHNIGQLCKYLKLVKDVEGPVLLHVVTEKGHGFQPAAEDPVFFHTPVPFQRNTNGSVSFKKISSRSYTNVASQAIYDQLTQNRHVTVMTAAMCQGNNLERVREGFPDRFFDTGICESHAVAFAAGQAKSGLRPIVDIYSTFLQRSYDQIFQEVALQKLPVTFLLDRAGLTGPDGPTHHGAFDIGYMRVFPNMVVTAPGDEYDLPALLDFALGHDAPVSIRYPKCTAEKLDRPLAPIELGRAEVIEWGHDGMFIAFGTLMGACLKAAETLRGEGLDVGVMNARFAKPLDTETIFRALESCSFVLTVEEGCLMGGFGSAVIEAAADAGISTAHVRRLGIPDRFIEHAERGELLSDLGLDVPGLVTAARELAHRIDAAQTVRRQVS